MADFLVKQKAYRQGLLKLDDSTFENSRTNSGVDQKLLQFWNKTN